MRCFRRTRFLVRQEVFLDYIERWSADLYTVYAIFDKKLLVPYTFLLVALKKHFKMVYGALP